MEQGPTFLTIRDVCDLLKVKESFVRRKIHEKTIPFMKVGRLIRFEKEELMAWIKK